MSRIITLVALLALVSTLGAAQAGSGRLLLKDASNADRAVGAAREDGIPQAHVLKVCLEEGRFGTRMAAGAQVSVAVDHADERDLAQAEGVLDDNGYGEFLIQVPVSWELGVYQVRLEVAKSGRNGKEVGRTSLGGTFRVIEGEPDPNIPEGWPALLLALGALGMLLWWRPSRPA